MTRRHLLPWMFIASLSLPAAAASLHAKTANPNADAKTRALLACLEGLPSRKDQRVLSGQMCSAFLPPDKAFDEAIGTIHAQAGKWVALAGADYVNGWPPRAGQTRAVNVPLIRHARAGGIVTVMVSFNNPWTGKTQNDKSGNEAFSELIDPATGAGGRLRSWLDIVAEGLAELQREGVPVLFRPLHENNGPWFWWGARSPDAPSREEFAALWAHIFGYLTHEKHLNNLLWVFSASAREAGIRAPAFKDELAHYPGDALVDVIGLDIYSDALEIPAYPRLVATGKPLAISEIGCAKQTARTQGAHDYAPLIRQIREKYPALTYFMFWNTFTNARETIHYGLADQRGAPALLSDPWVVTRDELPGLLAPAPAH